MDLVALEDVSFAYPAMAGSRRRRRLAHQSLVTTRPVLEGISLVLAPGETLGVIGGNGSGKSTLLKVMSGILRPTGGQVMVKGTVAPLIELGAGFDTELSVEENVLLYAALLGVPTRVSKPRVSAILDWAGLQEYADWPLRTLSSGMAARLGFSVATSIDADVLLVDEVLSVGDRNFQRKSRLKFHDFVQGRRAVTVVSHDLNFIREIATSVVWMEYGRIRMAGDPESVVSAYSQSE